MWIYRTPIGVIDRNFGRGRKTLKSNKRKINLKKSARKTAPSISSGIIYYPNSGEFIYGIINNLIVP